MVQWAKGGAFLFFDRKATKTTESASSPSGAILRRLSSSQPKYALYKFESAMMATTVVLLCGMFSVV
ncbi:MAG: hypothetical protein RSD27_07570 [Ruthenibacterium sp.]